MASDREVRSGSEICCYYRNLLVLLEKLEKFGFFRNSLSLPMALDRQQGGAVSFKNLLLTKKMCCQKFVTHGLRQAAGRRGLVQKFVVDKKNVLSKICYPWP